MAANPISMNVGKIKLKNINDLLDNKTKEASTQTPPKLKKRNKRSAATTTKKVKIKQDANLYQTDDATTTSADARSTIQSERKLGGRSTKKAPPPGQQRIDTFFKSTAKDYKVKCLGSLRNCKSELKIPKTSDQNNTHKSKAKKVKGRKRLFSDKSDTTDASKMMSFLSNSDDEWFEAKPYKRKTPKRKLPMRSTKKKQEKKATITIEATIDLCSSSEEGDNTEEVLAELEKELAEPLVKTEIKEESKSSTVATEPCIVDNEMSGTCTSTEQSNKVLSNLEKELAASLMKSESKKNNESTTDSCIADSETSAPSTSTKHFGPNGRTKKPKPIPDYKIVEGTTFAVDAFQFGDIPNVTHYFLTHYHADHYVGLSGKFCQTLYASPVTARLVQAFIPLDAQYLHEIDLNKPLMLEEVEITAIDANHCPGAVMFLFKLKTGRCILHTGDFRANPNMESEPIFWNNDISLVYLDTTYLTVKYDFCDQHVSIDRAIDLVSQFREKHAGLRILYICGTYVIGKEKMWSALAHEFGLQVWMEPQRYKAMKAIGDANIDALLTTKQENADMHVISMMKVGYLSLVEYFQPFESQYDVLLAIRPSGWEKNSRPQYRGRINIIGIEYSEHSSYKELERFVKFLKPAEVISTVPVGRDLCVTSTVPLPWYQYKGYGSMVRNFQPSISTFMTNIKTSANKLRSKSNGTSRSKMIISPMSTVENENTENINSENMAKSEMSVNDAECNKSIDICEADMSAVHGAPNSFSNLPVSKSAKSLESIIYIDITSDAADDWLT